MERAEVCLNPAWSWVCPHCGGYNYSDSCTEEDQEDPSYIHYIQPEYVRCGKCLEICRAMDEGDEDSWVMAILPKPTPVMTGACM